MRPEPFAKLRDKLAAGEIGPGSKKRRYTVDSDSIIGDPMLITQREYAAALRRVRIEGLREAMDVLCDRMGMTGVALCYEQIRAHADALERETTDGPERQEE